MPEQTFSIQVTIDGSQAKAEAGRLRDAIQKQLMSAGAIRFDTSALEKVLKSKDIGISGLVRIEGLEQASTGLTALQAAAAQPVVIQGRVDIQGLEESMYRMAQIRRDAGSLGRAIAASLSQQWVNLEGKLAELQSKITGLVRPGEKVDIAADMLEGMPELEAALADQDKKTLDLTLKMQELQARVAELNQAYAQLGRIKIQPLAGGELRTMSELMKGLTEPYHKGKIRRAVRDIDAELAPLEATVRDRMRAAVAEAEKARGPLLAEIQKVKAEMEAMMAERPVRPPTIGGMPAYQEAMQQWEAQFAQMEARYLELTRELDVVRTTAMTGDAEDMKNQLMIRRHQLEGPLREDFAFWREWSTESVEQLAADLRAAGQSAAAEALQQMMAIFQERKRLQTQMKRAFGGLLKGGEAELPAGAKGTMVDFVNAERALATAAGDVNAVMVEQKKLLTAIVKRMEEAAMAAEGLGKTERYAIARMEATARREMMAATKAGVPLEEAGAAVTSIMARLTVEAKRMRSEMVKALEDQQQAEAAERAGQGVIGVWRRVRQILVGRSIIPDMVHEIEVWLASIGQQQSPFAHIRQDAADASAQIISEFARLAQALPAEAIASEVNVLEAEIRDLERAFQEASVSGSEAGERYKLAFRDAAEEVRRVLGSTPEVEAKLAQGMLPQGFGVGAGESRWQKTEGAAARRAGATREGDVWYQAIKVDIDEAGRRAQAELDAIAGQIVQKRARLAALQQEQLVRMANTYEQAAATAQAEGDPAAAEQLANQLAATYSQIGQAEEALVQAQREVGEMVQVEADREAERIRAAGKEYARASAVGQVDVQAAKAAAAEVIEQERRVTAEVKRHAQYRAKQKEEAAKRATLKARAQREAEIQAAKAAAQAEIADAKAIATVRVETQKAVTAAVREAARQQTAQTKAALAEEKRAATERARLAKVEAQARQLAAQLGIQWDSYISGAMEAGASVDHILGTLRRVASEQSQINRQTRQWGVEGQRAQSRIARFGRELSRARMETHGIHMVLSDVDRVGRTIQYTSTALTGALTMAGRQYLELATQTDVAARSLMLSTELAQQLRQEVVGLSADMGLVDPQQMAQGITIWAQATGQEVNELSELQEVLRQTVPMQALATLSQTQLGLVTDGTAATIRQFGLTLADTDRVVAIFNKTADDTLAAVGDMTDAFKYVGPQAHAMGEEVEDTAAVLGIMADQNIRGSQAGRAYRMMLLSLIEPTKKTREALEGVFGDPQPFYDAQGRFVGLAQVIDMLAASTELMTEQEREALLATMFTSNAMPAVTALVGAQIEARKEGINAIRAEAKLLRGVIDEEVQGYADLRQETEGVNISMMGAMEVWQKQLDSWEESDVRRVQQAQMRWKAFWLALGESALNYALPYLERGSELLTGITEMVRAHPELGSLVAIGVSGTALSTLFRIVVSTTRTVTSVQSMALALERTTQQQATAGANFNTQVVSAGERFAALVTGAAEQAAGTEVAGAQQETAIETAGAQQEAAITQASARSFASTIGSAMVALGVGELLSRQLTGQGLGGWFTTREGEAAGQARMSELAQATEEELEAALLQVQTDLTLIERFAGETTSALEFYSAQVGLLFGQAAVPGDYERLVELMGSRWEAMSSAALADKLTELRAFETGLAEAIASLDLEADAADLATEATGSLNTSLYELAEATGRVKPLTDEETRAVELYVELLQKQAEAVDDFNSALAKALADLNADLNELDAEYRAEERQAKRDFRREQAKAEADFRYRQAKALRDHLIKMARMEQDHLIRMGDLARKRDALGMLQERRRYDLQRSRAEEDFDRSRGDQDADFKRTQAERARQHAERMAQMRAEHEREKAARIAAYEAKVDELEAQHEADMERLEAEYFEKLNAELRYFQQSRRQHALWQAAMLKDARLWLSHHRQIWLNYVRNLPTPQYTGSTGGRRRTARQSGGPIAETGQYTLHRGEYVLNPETTRLLERGLGGLTQQRLVETTVERPAGVIAPAFHFNPTFRFEGSLTAGERAGLQAMVREESFAMFSEAFRAVTDRR
jgi:TP901 family phage tail tape measure protein